MAAHSKAAKTCDRARLEGFVNQYLAALVAQDPSKLPLAKNARYTENGQELKLGEDQTDLSSSPDAFRAPPARGVDPRGELVFRRDGSGHRQERSVR